MKRREFIKLACVSPCLGLPMVGGTSKAEIDEVVQTIRSCSKPLKFDPSDQCGSFLYILPDLSRKDAIKILKRQCKLVVPSEYQHRITWVAKSKSDWSGDEATIGWRYDPKGTKT